MSFKDVWGFDPNEVIRTQSLFRHDSDKDESINEDEQRAARIPVDVYSQICELRRMFRS
jgi:hypothetical protein